MLLRWVDLVVLVVGSEPMRKSLALNDLQLGFLQGMGIQLAAALGTIPVAWLADRFDRRKVLAICVLAWSAATVWRAFAMSFGEVMSSTVGMAVADAALGPIAYALLPLLFRGRQLSQANVLFYAAGTLGYSGSMMIVGALFKALETHHAAMPAFLAGMESWRSASFLVGSLGPFFALMVLLMPTASQLEQPSVPGRSSDPPATVGGYLRTHWRAMAGVYGAMALVSLGLSPLLVWIAPAVARHFGLDPAAVGAEVGLLLIVATLAGLGLASMLQRVLGNRHGILVPMHVAPVLCVLTALAFAGIGLAGARHALYAGVLIATISLVAYNASMPTVLQRIVPGQLRARLTAIAFAAVTGIAAAGPIVVGWISDALHTSNGILIALAVVGGPTAAAAALVRRGVRPHVQAAVRYCEAADSV